MEENKEATTPQDEKKEITFVYAGRRRYGHLHYYLEDGKLGDEYKTKEPIFTGCKLGASYALRESAGSIFYHAKQKGVFVDFEDRIKHITAWKQEDFLRGQTLRTEKEIKDIHRFNPFKDFKQYYKSKTTIEKNLILIDLINYLNNEV